jgi:hypothetical protein
LSNLKVPGNKASSKSVNFAALKLSDPSKSGISMIQKKFMGAVQATMQKKNGLGKFEKNVNNMQAI